MNPVSTILYFKDAKSDKRYNASIEKSGKLFVVNFAYGKRDGKLKEGTKTPKPVSYEKAKIIYDNLINSKTDKGYAPEKTTKAKEVKKAAPKKTVKKKATSKTKEKTRDTETLFKELKTISDSEKNPVPFLNALTINERNILRPQILAYLKTQDIPHNDPSIFHRKIWYSFVADLEDHRDSHGYNNSLGRLKVVDDLIAHYQPDWLDEEIEVSYLDYMRYAQLGYVKSYDKNGKNHGLLKSLESVDDLDEKEREKALYTHKESIEEHIWGFFRESSPISKYSDWTPIFHKLIKDKKITRAQVIKNIHAFGVFGATEANRHFDFLTIMWILELFRSLEPSLQETVKLQPLLFVKLDPEVYIDIRKDCIEHVRDIAAEKGFDLPAGCKAIGDSLPHIKFTYWKNYKKIFLGLLENPAKDKRPVYKALLMGFENPNKKIRDAITALIKAKNLEALVEKEKPKAKAKKKVTGGLSQAQIDKVSTLLLSVDDVNAKIALNILENQPFPEELITEIALLYHTTTDKEIRAIAADLLNTHGSEELRSKERGNKTLATPGKLDKTNETTLKNKIKKLVTGNELDGVKFTMALFKKYGAGINYLLDETSEKQQEAVLNVSIEGTKLDLNTKALNKFPTVILNFPKLTELDLSINNIRSLPADIDQLKNLEILNLSNNNLKKFPKKIVGLKKLEYLDLQRNDVSPLPKHFFELRSLKTLKLNIDALFDKKGLNPLFSNFTQLEEFELTDKHYRTTTITGQPIDMDPLVLSRLFFKNGLKVAGYNLYKNGTAEDRKSVLAGLYDKQKKMLEVTELGDAPVCEEIKEFEITTLIAKRTDFGVRAMEAFPAHFKNLETIEFWDIYDGNEYRPTPDFAPFKNLKNLRLSKCNVSELTNLSALKKLEFFQLYNAKLSNFPYEIFELTNLRNLDMNTSGKTIDFYKGVPDKIARQFKRLPNLKSLYLFISDEMKEQLQPFLAEGCRLRKV